LGNVNYSEEFYKGYLFPIVFQSGFGCFVPSVMIEQTLKYSLGLVDSMMVAGVGEAAALLVGGSAVVSQYIGAEEPLKSNHYL
jgi:hypothetical protein